MAGYAKFFAIVFFLAILISVNSDMYASYNRGLRSFSWDSLALIGALNAGFVALMIYIAKYRR